VNLEWVQWGNVPAWIGAVGTPVGLFYTARAFNRQRKESAAENMRRREALARQVHVLDPQWIRQWASRTRPRIHELRVTVDNQAAALVRSLRVWVVVPDGYERAGQIAATEPPQTVQANTPLPLSLNLDAGDDLPDDYDPVGYFAGKQFGKVPEPWITFYDGDGVAWRRAMTGELTELSSLPEPPAPPERT